MIRPRDGDRAPQDGDGGPRPAASWSSRRYPIHNNQTAQAEQGVKGNPPGTGPSGSRPAVLELGVVLDDPDNKENEASQDGGYPG